MNYKNIDTLVHLFLQGDKKSQDQLINIFIPIIKNISTRYNLVGYDYEDICQECYIALLESIKKYKPNESFIPYGISTIKNHIYNIIKSQKRIKRDMELVAIDEKLVLYLSCEMDNNLETYETKKILHDSFLSLSAKEYLMIKFLYYDKKTLSTYARLNNIPYTLARSKKIIILQKLKKKLLECDFIYEY